ncbi:MAG: hypothetical protein H7Y17_14940 [Chlorobia bacterium]|nr:hypothetical protein [Fimbriimonadaceae bacterium]
MRKRWVWIGVTATALILAVFALIPREPDGLDFIRKYQPSAEQFEQSYSPGTWRKVFVFRQIPPALLRELRKLTIDEPLDEGKESLDEVIVFRLPADPNCWGVAARGTIIINDGPEPSWLTRQWQRLMNRIE